MAVGVPQAITVTREHLENILRFAPLARFAREAHMCQQRVQEAHGVIEPACRGMWNVWVAPKGLPALALVGRPERVHLEHLQHVNVWSNV